MQSLDQVGASATITINYNTDYTISITATNRCVGNGITSDVLSVNIGMY